MDGDLHHILWYKPINNLKSVHRPKLPTLYRAKMPYVPGSKCPGYFAHVSKRVESSDLE